MSKKLWKIWQEVNNDYDTYDSAIVVAASALSARKIHPNGVADNVWDKKKDNWADASYDTDKCCWAKLPDIQCEYLGEAKGKLKEGTVICASFNAG